jgi:hypothetical protein
MLLAVGSQVIHLQRIEVVGVARGELSEAASRPLDADEIRSGLGFAP